MNKLIVYAQLVRLPNVFTAVADIVAGFLFVHATFTPLPTLVALVVASCLLYMAGMVLNDVYDVEQDTKERPHRPIPSGRIGRRWAMWLGYEMLLLGVGAAAIAGYLITGASALPWRPAVVAVLLAACIVAYDAGGKRTVVGPVLMGGCRFLNLLLGMSTAGMLYCGGPQWLLRFEYQQLMVAGGMGLYIVGVTWFARTEAKQSNRLQLALGTLTMMAGIALIGAFPVLGIREEQFLGVTITVWRLLLALLALTIGRRCAMAIYDPVPGNVQPAVKNAILSLIILNAAICLAVGGAMAPFAAIGVLALLLPTLTLGQWVYST